MCSSADDSDVEPRRENESTFLPTPDAARGLGPIIRSKGRAGARRFAFHSRETESKRSFGGARSGIPIPRVPERAEQHRGILSHTAAPAARSTEMIRAQEQRSVSGGRSGFHGGAAQGGSRGINLLRADHFVEMPPSWWNENGHPVNRQRGRTGHVVKGACRLLCQPSQN